jgi:hypothetical protein
MWITFTQRARRILRDRTAFYYRPGTTYDLPSEWAQEHIGEGTAIAADAPMTPVIDKAWTPPALGNAPLTVACVYKKGGIYDGRDYVQRLASAVSRHLTIPHRIVCLTDDARRMKGVETIKLRHGWPGFWSKVELYQPGLFRGPVLYLDLDTVVCGPMDAIAQTPGNVVASWDLQYGWLNSSLVLWRVNLSCVYDAMVADPDAAIRQYDTGPLWGDQGLLQDTLTKKRIGWRWVQESHPDAVWWHPVGMRDKPAPAGVSVALWYGHPKPHEVLSPWLSANWC